MGLFDLSKLFLQLGNFVPNNIPNDINVYPEIFMNQNVPKSRNLSPFDVRIFGSDLFRYVLDCFAYNFQVSYDSICCLLIG